MMEAQDLSIIGEYLVAYSYCIEDAKTGNHSFLQKTEGLR